MELLLAFVIGWAAGARGGEQGFRDVVDAARELRQSDEFRALMRAMKAHVATGLRTLSEVLDDHHDEVTPDSVVARVALLMRDRNGPDAAEAGT